MSACHVLFPEEMQFMAKHYTSRQSTASTCGKDYVPGDQLVINNGELRQLDPRHPRHGRLASLPVELDVVCGVAICTRRKHAHTHKHTKV